MASVKSWKEGEPGAPDFPADFEVVKNAVLQVTDIKTNRNKYYAIELHSAGSRFRVYTHYGRTDDLETSADAGVRESRFFATLADAQACYAKIYAQKTSAAKGYKEISLASARIGSHKLRGQSSGHVDDATLERMGGEAEAAAPVIVKSTLHDEVQALVRLCYEEATDALTSTVAAKITANGIETPLGVLTLGQIEKGQTILDEAYALFKDNPTPGPKAMSQLTDLSGEFYTVIPHRIGRSRAAAQEAIIDTLAEFSQKNETLQLMRDMLKVSGGAEGAKVLFRDDVDSKYAALGCDIAWLDQSGTVYREVKEYVERSQVKTNKIKVDRIFRIRRAVEHDVYDEKLGNHHMLFHGSRGKNWVGIMSRGILLPKIVVTLGVNRTDAGWLGSGIYFGNAACTSLYYTSPGRRKTRMLAIARVALGKPKEFRNITYGIDGPPKGFDSCHGVRNVPGSPSQFEDDELVVYRSEQQRLEFLVEYHA